MALDATKRWQNDILFCPIPANVNKTYSAASLADATLVASATDRQRTHSGFNAYWCDLTEQPKVNFLYVKSRNIDTISIYDGLTLVGSADASTWSVQTEQGAESDWEEDGYQNFVIALTLQANTDHRTTNLLKINITGINREIYEIAALYSDPRYRLKAESDADGEAQLLEFAFTPVLRNYATRRAINGELDFIPPLNNPPVRYLLPLGFLTDTFLTQNTKEVQRNPQILTNFFAENRKGFAMVNEYARQPSKVFTKAGLHPNFEIAIQKLVQDLKGRDTVYIDIAEA